MIPDFSTYTPPGFYNVNPYLFASNPEELISFLASAFGAEELNRSINPRTDEIGNCIMKIGNSCIMISQARGDFENMRTAFYLFVENVDEVYENALAHGGISSFPPADMDYEDRQAGVQDPAGNYWWISKRLVKKAYQD